MLATIMNIARLITVIFALICTFSGCVIALLDWMTISDGNMETAAFLLVAAILFAAPFAIIPARKKTMHHTDQIQEIGEIISSGFYGLTILIVMVMGWSYLNNLFNHPEGDGILASPDQTIVVVAFLVNLVLHVTSFVSASMRLIRS